MRVVRVIISKVYSRPLLSGGYKLSQVNVDIFEPAIPRLSGVRPDGLKTSYSVAIFLLE
jgi:hypothetical protein